MKRIDVWLDARGLETLAMLQLKYGSSKSGAIRAGLEYLRRQIDGLPEDSGRPSQL